MRLHVYNIIIDLHVSTIASAVPQDLGVVKCGVAGQEHVLQHFPRKERFWHSIIGLY